MFVSRFQSSVAVAALLAVITSCGGGGGSNTNPPPAQREFLYTTSVVIAGVNITESLSSYKLDATTGGLSSTSSNVLPGLVLGVAVGPTAKYLYASAPNFNANAIDIFSITPTTGEPTQAGAFLLSSICALCGPPPSGPGLVALSPDGKTLYYGSSTLGGGAIQGIGALRVNSTDGSLSLVPGSPFPADDVPFYVVVHPSGKFVFTANISAATGPLGALQSVSCFSSDPTTGALTPVAGSPFAVATAAKIAGFVMHPSGKFLYAATGSAGNGILGWTIDATSGAVTPLPGSPFAVGSVAVGAVIDRAGKYLYTGGGASGGLLGFSVDAATGALTALAGSPFDSGSTLGSPAVDTSGSFLFAPDLTNKILAGFRLDPMTGGLTALGSSVPATVPTGGLVFVKAP